MCLWAGWKLNIYCTTPKSARVMRAASDPIWETRPLVKPISGDMGELDKFHEIYQLYGMILISVEQQSLWVLVEIPFLGHNHPLSKA